MSNSFLSRFVGGTISVGLGNLSTMILGLLGAMLAARYLTAEALGTFVLLQVVVAFLTQVSSLGLNISVPRFIASTEDKQHRRERINTIIYFRMLTIFVVSIVTWIARPALSVLFGSSLLLSFVMFIPLLFLLHSLSELLKAILEGLFLFRIIAIVDFIASLFNVLLIVVCVLLLDQDVRGLVYAKAISMTLACVFAYLAMPVEKRFEFHLGMLKELLMFGLPLQVNDILVFVFGRIDTLMISTLLGPAEVAYYEIARKIPESLSGLYGAFRSVFFPFISRFFALGEKEKASPMLNHSTRLISFVTILGALIALLFGNEIITLLFSGRYLPSVPAFVLLMIVMNFALSNYTLGYSLVAVGESNKPVLVNTVHTIVSLLGNVVLIPIFGISGAALSSLAGFFLKHPLNVIFLRRKGVNVRIRGYLKPVLIFSAFGLMIHLFYPAYFLLRIFIIILFVFACLLFSVITRQDLVAILGEGKIAFSAALRNLRCQVL